MSPEQAIEYACGAATSPETLALYESLRSTE